MKKQKDPISKDRIRYHIHSTLAIINRNIKFCLVNPEKYRDVLESLYDMKAKTTNELNSLT